MVAEATLVKQSNALITQYIKSWTERYGKSPVLNRYKWKWAFRDMVEDLGYERAKEVVAYYFRTNRLGHPIEHIAYNYDQMHKILLEREADDANIEKLKKETEQRVKEWEEKIGDQGS